MAYILKKFVTQADPAKPPPYVMKIFAPVAQRPPIQHVLKAFAPTPGAKLVPHIFKKFEAPPVAGPPTRLPVDTSDYVGPAPIVSPPFVPYPKPKIVYPPKRQRPVYVEPQAPPPLVLTPPAPEPGSRAWKVAQFVTNYFPKK